MVDYTRNPFNYSTFIVNIQSPSGGGYIPLTCFISRLKYLLRYDH